MIRVALFVALFVLSLACHAELETVKQVDDTSPGLFKVRIDAEVSALQQASVSAKVPGQLIWVAQLGEKVAKGDPIAEQDSTGLELEIARIKAVFQQTAHEIDYLQNDLSRLLALESKQLVSRHQTDEARLKLHMNMDELAILDAQLAIVEYELMQMTIRAPFDGIVAKRTRAEGERLSPGEEVIHLFNPKSNQIRANVDTTLLSQLDKSYTYTFDNDAQSDTAELITVIPFVDPVTQTVEVIFKPQLAEIWMTGQHVTVGLPKAKMFSLSKRSVHKVGSNHYVDVKRANDVVRLQIEIVEEQQEKVIVSGLLKEGDRVVSASS